MPCQQLEADRDPDLLWNVVQAYAGQVSLWDTCLGAIIDSLDSSGLGDETLLMVLSARGLPMGEHGWIGPCADALYGPLVHVPWVMRFPDQRAPRGAWSIGARLGEQGRSQALVEPGDVWATLLDWWQLGDRPAAPSAQGLLPLVRDEVEAVRDRLGLVGRRGEPGAIRTPAWYLRMGSPPELYVKPDDRWEANNVAARCHEVVETLEDAFSQYRQAIHTGSLSTLTPLPHILANGLE